MDTINNKVTEIKLKSKNTEVKKTVGNKVRQADLVVVFVKDDAELFYDDNMVAYAVFNDSGIAMPIDSDRFISIISAKYYRKFNKSISLRTLKEVATTLSGVALHTGELKTVFKRVAKFNDNYYLDLCQTNNSKAVEINHYGWRVVDKPPVMFLRTNSMQALPIPKVDGDISKLWDICNLPENYNIIITAYLIELMRCDTPYPLLELFGEQGASKSTTQRFLRRVIDPNFCDLRSLPKKSDDLFVSTSFSHIMSFENASVLSQDLQDDFCRLSTGAGQAKRKLYSNAEEVIINAKNPIMINGINPVVTSHDLIDRCIIVELLCIVERKEVTVLNKLFESQHAVILGGLLDVFVQALSILPSITLDPKTAPRLIEFTKLGMAVSKSQGLSEDYFLGIFNQLREEAIVRTIDSSAVALALQEWVLSYDIKQVELPTKSLYCQLSDLKKNKEWPESYRAFSNELRRLTPILRRQGVICANLGKKGSNVLWRITNTAE